MTYENIKEFETNLNKILNNNKKNISNSSMGGNVSGALDVELRSNIVEIADLTGLSANYVGYSGCCFDGRYIYLVPYANGSGRHGYFLRYDTQPDSFVVSSVDVFDLTTISSSYIGFRGATFDGRYIYLIQHYETTGYAGKFLRYDTTASFASAGSYAAVDLTSIDAGLVGFNGLAFDGQYVYSAGYVDDTGKHGKTFRYDTTKAFSTVNIDNIDFEVIDSDYVGYADIINADRYIFYVPYADDTVSHGRIVKHDTYDGGFAAGSFELFDLTTINANYKGFYCGNYDGRYLYLYSYYDGASYTGLIVRYDTRKPLSDPGAYLEIDTTDYGASFLSPIGSVNDGRFTYGCPFTLSAVAYNSRLTKLDTVNAFDDPSVTGFDLGTISSNYEGFWGACFDGRYIYLIPYYKSSGGAAYHGNFIRIRTSITKRI